MTDEELQEVITSTNQRLDAFDGLMNEYHQLLSNHMTDLSAKFGRLKKSVDDAVTAIKEVNTARDQALNTKIDSYKWALKLIAIFTVIAVGGLVSISIWAISKVIGG